jgi:hypothetical protein
VRRYEPTIPEGRDEKIWLILIQHCNMIMHENLALRKLKPLLESFSWGLDLILPSLDFTFDHLTLQPEIDHLIAEDSRVNRSNEIMHGMKKGGFCVGADDYKDNRHKQILDCVIQWLHADCSPVCNVLGSERVGGERATGGQVFLSFLRMVIRNHLNVFMLEHLLIDGGSNFKGDVKGLVARLQALLQGVQVLTFEWCKIHRFYF